MDKEAVALKITNKLKSRGYLSAKATGRSVKLAIHSELIDLEKEEEPGSEVDHVRGKYTLLVSIALITVGQIWFEFWLHSIMSEGWYKAPAFITLSVLHMVQIIGFCATATVDKGLQWADPYKLLPKSKDVSLPPEEVLEKNATVDFDSVTSEG